MSILVDEQTRVLVQGITGRAARHHVELMQRYGTRVVSGVRPGAAGERVHGVPVFDTVREAVSDTAANAAVLFVPAAVMRESALETLQAGVRLLVMVTEHVPRHDTMWLLASAREMGARIIGPNTPGLIAPGTHCKIGFLPADYYRPGPVGVASRSGTLTYEIVARLSAAGIGQSTCLGVGGDAVVGTTFAEVARLFETDPETQAMLFIGEVGGGMEEELAGLVHAGEITKPLVAYIAGRTAPEGKRMGHAGAIVAGGRGSLKSKLAALGDAGVPVAALPGDVPELVRQALKVN